MLHRGSPLDLTYYFPGLLATDRDAGNRRGVADHVCDADAVAFNK
jgi:hypothetical protein